MTDLLIPQLTGALDADAAVLASYAGRAAQRFAVLPAKPERDEGQQAEATALHAEGRALRRAFLRRHARAVYAAVTEERTAHVSLAELSAAVAVRFVGLVPTQAQLERERQFLQRDKEALEIDQGELLHAWFALPDVGADLIERMRLPTAKALALLPELQQRDRLRIGPVELERRGDGGYLTFHNLSCLNAEDDALIDAFETAVDLVLLDERIKVGVLRGGVMDHERYRGRRVFSAGINLRHLSAGQISYLDFLLRRELGYINKMAHGLSAAGAEAGAVEKPWIAAVDSFAIGGGAQILLVCDRVIAEQGAYFSLPAAKEGIVPGLANLRLPRLVGARMAGQIILDGRRVSSTETDGRLLFDEVVHPAEMDAAIEQAVERFSAAAVIANRRMLRLLQEPAEALRSYFAQFALEQAQRIYSADVLAKVARV